MAQKTVVTEESFGQLLKRLRKDRELTQQDLAERVGLSKSYLSKLERDDRAPPLPTVRQLADHLGLSADETEKLVAAAQKTRQADRTGPESRPRTMPARVPPLPRQDHPPVGRAADLEAICAMLREGRRVINIAGDPAIGKTTLAKALAHQLFGKGRTVLWGDAREGEAKTPEEIEALLWRLLVGGDPLPDREQRTNRIRQALVRRDPLLFLDNLESAPDFDAVLRFIARIAPPATVICTSRRLIPATIGYNIPLYELAAEEGVVLFEQVGARYGQQVANAEESTMVRLICEDMLQGHPGAIEIAAALWRSWPLREILRGLRTRAMDTLVDPLRTDINRSMRLSIDLSYDLLALECEPAWSLFPRLAVFAASFALPAIEAVCQVDSPLPLLDYLVNRSLIRFDRERYSGHAVVREYGLAKLGDERQYYEQRTALYFLDYASQHAAHFDALEEEKGNLFAVMDWCEEKNEQQMALRFVDLLHTFMDQRGHWEERLSRTKRALQIAELLKDAGEVIRLCFVLGNTYRNRSELNEARSCYERGLTLALSPPGDKNAAGTAYSLLADLAYQQDDLAQAHAYSLNAADLFTTAGLSELVPLTYSLLVSIEKRANNLEQAHQYAEKELQGARETGDVDLEDIALRDLFELALDLGRYDRAEGYLQDYQALAEQTREPLREGHVALLRAMLAFEQKRWMEAKEHFLTALPTFERHAGPTEMAVILEGLAEVSVRTDDLVSAEGYLKRYVTKMQALGNFPKASSGLERLAELQEKLGKSGEARDSIGRSRRPPRDRG